MASSAVDNTPDSATTKGSLRLSSVVLRRSLARALISWFMFAQYALAPRAFAINAKCDVFGQFFYLPPSDEVGYHPFGLGSAYLRIYGALLRSSLSLGLEHQEVSQRWRS